MKRGILSLLLVLSLCFLLDITLVQANETGTKNVEGNISKTIEPYMYFQAEKQEESIKMSGKTYTDAILMIMGYTGTSTGYMSEVEYNLKGNYTTVSFDAGYCSGAQRDAKFSVIADNRKIYDSVAISRIDIAKRYTINVTGVSHLTIKFESDGYDKTKYAIGDICMTSATEIQEESVLESNVLYSCDPYFYQNASSVTDDFEMGGYKYREGIDFSMGYTGYSTGGTSIASFNFPEYYKSISFDIGRYAKKNSDVRNAKLTITADDKILYEDELISWNDIPRKFTINLEGVSQLTIKTVSSGYDKVHYRMGNIKLVSDGIVRGIVFKKTKVNVSTGSPKVQLEPVVVPRDAKNQGITLKSDSTITAVVDENAMVTGRHKGTATITATTNEGNYTASCTVNSTLPYAKYVPSVNGWGFDNTCINIIQGDSLSNLYIDDYYEEVYKRITGEYALYALKNDISKVPNGPMFLYYTLAGNSAAGGVCYGYSLSSALTYTGDIPFSGWSQWDSKPKVPYDIKQLTRDQGYSSSLDMYLKQFIFGCHISQGSKKYVVNNWIHKNKYDDLIAKVKNFQNTGKNPILIKLTDDNSHEVMPYEVIENDETIDVYIYDCNLEKGEDADPDDNKIVFTKDKNGKITGWNYGTGYSSINGDISYVDSLSTVAERLKNSEQLIDPVKRVLYVTSKSFEVKNKLDTLVNYSKKRFSGNTTQSDIVPVEMAHGSDVSSFWSEGQMLYQFTDDEIAIKNNSADKEVTTLIGNKDSAFILKSDGKSKIISNKGGSEEAISIIPSTNSNITVRYNYGNNDSIEITGRTSNGVNLAVINDKKDISLDGFKDIQITVIKNGEEKKNDKISLTPTNKYVVSNDGKVDGKDLNNKSEVLDDSKVKEQNQEVNSVSVKSVKITGISKQIAAGKKIKLYASVLPKNATGVKVIWSSSNKKAAKVNEKGVVTFLKKTGGKSVIITAKATASDGSTAKAAYKLRSMKGIVKKISISGNKTVKAGKSLKLKAQVVASKGANKKLKWSSSNTKYAKVNFAGKVTAYKAGKGKKVKITAMATDGSQKKKTLSIKIK